MRDKEHRRKKPVEYPSLEQMEDEISHLKYQSRFGRALRGTLYSLAVVAAVAILIATLWIPVLRITGSSMTPTMSDGEFVAAVKTDHFKTGDIIAFYYNNKILVKRVIALEGDWVDIDKEGNVSVNGNVLNEPYLEEKSLGECTIQLPYQVPDGKTFVMGDDRPVSLDSRTSVIGSVGKEQVLGRIVFRLWPLSGLGKVG